MGYARLLENCHEAVKSIPRHAPLVSTRVSGREHPCPAALARRETESVRANSCGLCSFESPPFGTVGVSSHPSQPLEKPEQDRRHQHGNDTWRTDLPPNFSAKNKGTASECDHQVLRQNYQRSEN